MAATGIAVAMDTAADGVVSDLDSDSVTPTTAAITATHTLTDIHTTAAGYYSDRFLLHQIPIGLVRIPTAILVRSNSHPQQQYQYGPQQQYGPQYGPPQQQQQYRQGPPPPPQLTAPQQNSAPQQQPPQANNYYQPDGQWRRFSQSYSQ